MKVQEHCCGVILTFNDIYQLDITLLAHQTVVWMGYYYTVAAAAAAAAASAAEDF